MQHGRYSICYKPERARTVFPCGSVADNKPFSVIYNNQCPRPGSWIALKPDALHRETQRRLSTSANAHSQPLVLERGYTNQGQLGHLTLRGANSAASEQQYQYDALGRMNFRSIEGDQASKVIAYSYDAAGRLIRSQHGDQAHRYSVDAAGNRLEGQQALSDNRLGQLNGTRYRYDGLGRRISKTVRHTNGTTATTHYGWDGDRIVREETDNQRTTVVYEPGSFVPMLRIDDTLRGQVLSTYITAALGTPMQLVTPNGQTRWLAEPDDWAAVKNQRAVRNVTQPIRFQGQWHDEESGLYYNRHRYYDPQQGRYISQDPIGLNGGTNLYGYVTNPTRMVDPLGLLACGGLCIAGVVVGGTAVVNWTRNYWNEPVSDITDVQDWTELTPEESIYHRMGEGNDGNRKFVSPNGRSEAVFDCNDDLVTDPANAGTYNFFGPRFMGGVPHGVTDVLPYYIFGTSPSDMFNPQRFTTTYEHLTQEK